MNKKQSETFLVFERSYRNKIKKGNKIKLNKFVWIFSEGKSKNSFSFHHT